MKLGDYKHIVVSKVPIEVYYHRIFPQFVPSNNVLCPFHDDKVASLSIDIRDGGTYCHACDHKSSSVVGFHEQKYRVSFEEALKFLCDQFIEKLVPESELKEAREHLEADQEVLAHIQTYMGLTKETVSRLGFGLSTDRERIWIPVLNEVGWTVDVRKYYWRRPRPKDIPKTISYRKEFGGARFWPRESLEFETVYWYEGERDTALAWQDGFPAITLTTGGKTHLTADQAEHLRGKNVVFVPHLNDKEKTGEVGVEEKVKQLRGVVATLKVVVLDVPKELEGGDYSDYRLGQRGARPHTADEFKQLVEDSGIIYRAPTRPAPTRGEHREITLREVPSALNFDRNVQVRAHVVAKFQTPWLIPKKYKASCDSDAMDKCDGCPLKAGGGARVDILKETDRAIVGMCGASDDGISKIVKGLVGAKSKCHVDVSVQETHRVMQLSLVPELDVADHDQHGEYTIQTAYAVGCDLEANKGYDFKGYVTSHPHSQAAVLVVIDAQPIQDSIDKFSLSQEDISSLKIFQSNKLGDLFSRQAKVMSTNVTKIRGRDDLWLFCDLVFHSVQGFMFGDELVPKGWLDALLIGDTRCGKGYTAERLVQYYRLGEVISGENCSYAGLVGGMLQQGDRWQIVWGKLPLNDRRLAVIDEAKSMSVEDIGRMSRLRSEGIAEVSKIQTERTHARTRLLMITNSRSGRLMRNYDYGVNAVQEFVEHSEDIARFDIAMAVTQGEVDKAEINIETPAEIENPWPRDAARKLVLWVWSRRPDQVRFTSEAVKAVLQHALVMGDKYSSAIPLVQVENVRYKIARVACAVAAKAFRTKDGEVLVVDEQCVNFAAVFMENCYDKHSMSYNYFSDSVRIEESAVDEEKARAIISKFDDQDAFIRGMLSCQSFSAPDMADFTGIDQFETKLVIGKLVRHACIFKTGPVYRKRPGFINILRKVQAERTAKYLENGRAK